MSRFDNHSDLQWTKRIIAQHTSFIYYYVVCVDLIFFIIIFFINLRLVRSFSSMNVAQQTYTHRHTHTHVCECESQWYMFNVHPRAWIFPYAGKREHKREEKKNR